MSGPAIDMFYDENSEQNIESSDNSTSVVVDWLNQASLADTTEKVTLIKKIQEYILHKEPSLAKTYWITY
ncbi:symplekin-like [Ctenocephalides felis]|uniref:symplekin-like n=1 Tax=Ctenocephalides felis TaxID=7515 RepID=UPI000E6E2C47|nr:symplekin-like [Ctenocephalides felis]